MKRPNSLLILIFLFQLAIPSAFAIVEQHVPIIDNTPTSILDKPLFRKSIGIHWLKRLLDKGRYKHCCKDFDVLKSPKKHMPVGTIALTCGLIAILLVGTVFPFFWYLVGYSAKLLILLLVSFILSILAVLKAAQAEKGDIDAEVGKYLGLITLAVLLILLAVFV